MTELRFIETVLREAGVYAREKYLDRASLKISSKSSANDFLTEADLGVQQRIVERIGEQYPGDLVLAEESGFSERPEGRFGRCWVLDPIDGTSNFVRGLFPAWGISLAFADREQVTSAGIYFPMTDNLFLAEKGAGATRNTVPLRTSEIDAVDLSRMDFDISGTGYRHVTIERAPELYARIGQLRVHGCAVAALCSVATGDSDGYLHVALNAWDYAAGVLIVEESGGRATRWDGSSLTLFDGRNSLICTNGRLHDAVLPLLGPE